MDFQCPICRTYHPIIEQLEDAFAGELMVVQRHLPLASIHDNAEAAARAAEAAGRQGNFLEMGDLLFENQPEWEFESDPVPFFELYAGQLDLDLIQFRADMIDPTVDERIERDRDAAFDLGATASIIENSLLVYPQIQFHNIFIFPGVPQLLRVRFGAIKERFRQSEIFCKEIRLWAML